MGGGLGACFSSDPGSSGSRSLTAVCSMMSATAACTNRMLKLRHRTCARCVSSSRFSSSAGLGLGAGLEKLGHTGCGAEGAGAELATNSARFWIRIGQSVVCTFGH